MDTIALIRWGLNVCELAACITGFLYWRKQQGYWRWFPIYLAVIVCIELVGKYFWYVRHDVQVNAAIYRYLGLPIQFLFFYWLFRQYFTKNDTPLKHWPYIGALIYLLSWVVDAIWLSNIKFWFSSFSYTIGNIILLVLLFAFFIRMLRSEDILNYKTSQMFWVALGLLFFYLGTLPFYGLRNTLSENYYDLFMVYWYIHFALDYLMYIFFILSFVWGKQK
jgi:hypothetical protein